MSTANGRSTFEDAYSASRDVRPPQGPLKRPREWDDYDEYGRNVRRRSPGPERASVGEYRTAAFVPRSRSPADTRHSFIPDRRYHRRSDSDRHLPFARSPSHNSPRGRNGERSPDHRRRPTHVRTPSPVAFPPSPKQHRSSPPQRRAQPHDASPPFYSDGSLQDQILHNNLSWTNPDARPKSLSSRAQNNIPRTQDSRRATVDFNGLQRVPSGPKPKPPGFYSIDRSLPVEIDQAVKRLPHIFIPARSLPPKRATLKHLHRFLEPFAANVLADQSGYFVTFENGPSGAILLDQCYRQKHLTFLFREYELDMTPFPSGQVEGHEVRRASVDSAPRFDARDRIDTMTGASASLSIERAGAPTPTGLAVQHSADGNNLQKEQPVVPNPSNAGPTSPPLIIPPAPSDTFIRSARQSPPARVPSRQDRDDSSSSVSGFTDMSASKHPKCHICKATAASDTDALVQCSSCPRRYHRRCHTQFGVPHDVLHGLSWQCRRCVRKEVRPRSRLSNESNFATESSVRLVEPPQRQEVETESEPRVARLANEGPLSAAEAAARNANATVSGVKETIVHTSDEAVDSGKDSASPPLQPKALTNTAVPSDDMHQSADELVEKSFTEPPMAISDGSKPLKADKPILIRKKIDRSSLGDSMKSHEGASSTLEQLQVGSEEVSEDQSNGIGTPKRRPHRWAGGGADRDIVRAGREALFTSPRSTHVEQTTVTGGMTSQNPLTDASLTAEVVPGPSEVNSEKHPPNHAASAISPTRKPATARQDGDANQSVKPKPQVNGAETRGLAQPKVAAHRIKPSNRRLAKCSKCDKALVPWDPSGIRKHCASCRKGAHSSAEPQALQTLAPKQVAAAEPGPKSHSTAPSSRKPSESENLLPSMTNGADLVVLGDNAVLTAASATAGAAQMNTAAHPGEDAGNSDLDFWNPPKQRLDPKAGTQLQNDSTGRPEPSTDQANDEDPSTPPLGPEPVPDPTGTIRAPRQKKRSCHTVTASGPTDLGNSETRPKGTYTKLIGMALLANSPSPMTSVEIVQWVADNIRNYRLGEGNNWENGIRATITMNQENNNSNNKGLWKPQEKSEPGKRKAAYLWELLPGAEKDLLQWDPVLKEPRSPDRSWSSRTEEKTTDKDTTETKVGEKVVELRPVEVTPVFETAASPAQVDQRAESNKRMRRPDTMRFDSAVSAGVGGHGTPLKNRHSSKSDASSDEEPVAHTRRQKTSSTPETHSSAHTGDEMDVDRPPQTLVAVLPLPRKRPSQPPPPLSRHTRVAPDQLTLAQVIKADAKNIDSSAQSLFDEWPEYDPAKTFDRASKLQAIAMRPSRKQRLLRSHFHDDPWMTERNLLNPSYDDSRQSSVSFERANRTPRKNNVVDMNPWAFEEGNERQFDTFEELFGLPNNAIAIMHEGQLAFRDGTRNEDGVLPRAREIFKVGYA